MQQLLSQLFGPLGLTMGLILLLIALAKGVLVFGWMYQDAVKRGDKYEERAWAALGDIAAPALKVAEDEKHKNQVSQG